MCHAWHGLRLTHVASRVQRRCVVCRAVPAAQQELLSLVSAQHLRTLCCNVQVKGSTFLQHAASRGVKDICLLVR